MNAFIRRAAPSLGVILAVVVSGSSTDAFSQSGMVPVPSFDTAPRRQQPAAGADPAASNAGEGDRRAVGTGSGAAVAGVPEASPSCQRGPAMEPREYTQPEVLGRPAGERARMCFFRLNGSTAEYLQFFPSGHFYHTSVSGSGGFAVSGAVYGTIRGNYGFRPGGLLAIRTGYQGTSVSQVSRGAGSERTVDVAGQGVLEREMTLPNCQKITFRDEIKRVQFDRGTGHPAGLTVDGVRWEAYRIDCPAWQGWIKDQ